MSQFSEVLQKIDAATTAAAERVSALITSIKSNGATLTAEDQAEANSIVTHLTAIGADESNPVPAPVDAPTT
jgi:hypothetical protein